MATNIRQRIFEETYIIQRISEGASNMEIADEMYLCDSSIKKKINAMFKRYGARNRAHLVGMVMRKEILR